MLKNNILFIILLFVTSVITARDWRVFQIPNGSKFSCANCHVDPSGGGTRNKFGQDVEKLVSPGSTREFWGLALARLDSDGDGKTNGQELGDPNGTWKAGQSNPGTFSLVSNPGDQASFTSVDNIAGLPAEYKLFNNYPNPFNPETVISYQLPAAGHVSLKVYDMLGNEVANLVDEYQQAGIHNSTFSIQNFAISSGVYFYRLNADSFIDTKKFVLTK
jgi:hypothetical protein